MNYQRALTAFDTLSGFDNPDELAGFLQQKGIRGRPQSEYSCPISRWMEKETGYNVSTDDKITGFIDRYERERSFDLTLTIIDFMDRFDRGHYPLLLEADYCY